jgi:RNA-directed DNA polymerase
VTVKKRMRTTLQAIGQILLRRRHEPIPVIGRWLGQVMRGYFAYFNVPGNEKRLEQFHREVRRYWMHALRRRSQRHRMTWERLNPITRHYLPYPRQVPKHPFPVARFGVMT